MFHDEFYYNKRLSSVLWKATMRYEEDPGEGGGDGEHWTDNYESTKGNAVLKRFKTEEDSHKGHIETKTALSDPLRLPKTLGKVTSEQVADYHARVGKLLGAPDTEDGYEITRPQLPKGMIYDEEGEKGLRAWAVKHHLSQTTLQEALDLWSETMISRSEALTKADKEAFEKEEKDNKAAVKACVETLEELWGKKECQEHLELIQRALRSKVNPDWRNIKTDDDEAWQDFNDKTYKAGISNNPVLMELLGVAAQVLEGEGKIIGGTPPTDDTKDEDLSEEQKQKKYFPKSPGMTE
jgi:hypothetical protein